MPKAPVATHCPDCAAAYGPRGERGHAGTCRERGPYYAACPYCGLEVRTGQMADHWTHCAGPPRTPGVPCRLCEGG